MPFAVTTEVRLIHFDLADQLPVLGGGQAGQRLPKPAEGDMGGWIGNADVLRGTVGAGLEDKGLQ
jgi:hypothetical protein